MKIKHELVIKDLGVIFPTEKSKKRCRMVIVECIKCKKQRKATWANVKKGKSKYCTSCAKITHGKAIAGHVDSLMNRYIQMKQRCYNKNHPSYKNYGGRGIEVCDEWKNSSTLFFTWAKNNGYKNHLELERKDNNKGYTPNNCMWVEKTINLLNRRKRKSKSKYRGVVYSKRDNKYLARITVNKKSIYIGCFNTEVEVAQAYDKYVIENKLQNIRNTYGN